MFAGLFAACLRRMTTNTATNSFVTGRLPSAISGQTAPPLSIVKPLLKFENIPSACPDDDVRVGRRMDPYWADVWPVGGKASWVDVTAARAQVAAGLGRIPAYLMTDGSVAEQRVADVARLPAHLNILSVLDSWRTATGEQLAAFTGQSQLASGKSRVMTDLFTTELVDVGVFSNALFSTRNAARGALYRPNATGQFEKKIASRLTYTEWISTTAGFKNRVGGGQHDRHNVIATELGLRIAELCSVGQVVGEKLSLADLLGYTGLGLPSKGPQYTRSGDLTVIRLDGAKIIVEATATIGRAMEAKIEHWVDLLASRRMNDSGLAVLFVIVDRPDGRTKNGVRNQVYKMLRTAVRDNPGFNFDRVASRIGVVDWREYFPEAGLVSPSFFDLQCDRPTGPPNKLWERAALLNNNDLPFHPDGSWPLDALDNLAMLRSVPHWLREGRNPPELWHTLLAEQKLKSIPVPPLSRPELAQRTREFGRSFGFASDTLPPKRLRSRL